MRLPAIISRQGAEMQNKLSETMKTLELTAYGLWLSLSYGLWRPVRQRRRGQTTVEYLLMLAVVVGMTLIVGVLFHKKILGGMFSLVGMVIGAGKPAAAP